MAAPMVHTDFYAVRPEKLRRDAFKVPAEWKGGLNAETIASNYSFREMIHAGRARWLFTSNPIQECRLHGGGVWHMSVSWVGEEDRADQCPGCGRCSGSAAPHGAAAGERGERLNGVRAQTPCLTVYTPKQ